MLRSLVFLALGLSTILAAAAETRPNIVIILADDMGFSDIGSYGSEIPTPSLDALAGAGARFARFYNTSRCCPTRAALLTGIYQHQAGIGHMVDDYAKQKREQLGGPAYTAKLNDRCVTIAEVLGSAGYETMMSGKWHVGNERAAWPDRRGFSRSFCVVSGAMNYFGSGLQHLAGQTVMQLELDGEPWSAPEEGFYATNAFTDRAVDFIKERKDPARPFFLYLAYNAPHWPLHALPEDIARHRGKYRDGFEKIRAARLERQIAAGLFPAGITLPEREGPPAAWENLSDAHRDEWDLRMAIYAAQMECMDRGIGKLMTTLREIGAEQNTLVMFLSDNGGCHENIERSKPGAALGTRDSYSSYRRAWSQVSNTPFRWHKHWTHEGGIATPCIARWPAQIKPGTFTREIGHVMDLMPTALAAAGVEYPKTFSGRQIAPAEGISLLPALRGERLERPQPLFWEHEGNRAVREGKWKLVSRFPGDWELYDMDADPTESRNVAADHPDRARDLSGKYDAWAERCNVRPWSLTVQQKPGQ